MESSSPTSDEIRSLVISEEVTSLGFGPRFAGRSFLWLSEQQPTVAPSVLKYLEKLLKALNTGHGLLCIGGRGTGKSSVLALVAEVARKTTIVRVQRECVLKCSDGRESWVERRIPWPCRVVYRTMPAIAGFCSSEPYGDAREAWRDDLERMKLVDMLLIDEVGVGEFRGNGEPTFFELIDGRIENHMPTCLAMNGDPRKLGETGSPILLRLLDKLRPVTIPLAFTGESRRKSWGKSADLDF